MAKVAGLFHVELGGWEPEGSSGSIPEQGTRILRPVPYSPVCRLPNFQLTIVAVNTSTNRAQEAADA